MNIRGTDRLNDQNLRSTDSLNHQDLSRTSGLTARFIRQQRHHRDARTDFIRRINLIRGTASGLRLIIFFNRLRHSLHNQGNIQTMNSNSQANRRLITLIARLTIRDLRNRNILRGLSHNTFLTRTGAGINRFHGNRARMINRSSDTNVNRSTFRQLSQFLLLDTIRYNLLLGGDNQAVPTTEYRARTKSLPHTDHVYLFRKGSTTFQSQANPAQKEKSQTKELNISVPISQQQKETLPQLQH